MIATGTDVRPLECVFFMRAVKSRVATLTGIILIGVSPALRRSVAYFGWDNDALSQWLEHALPISFACVDGSASSNVGS